MFLAIRLSADSGNPFGSISSLSHVKMILKHNASALPDEGEGFTVIRWIIHYIQGSVKL
jgi:hypothetical protein